MIHKKLLSLLVLLMTAATGAWADIAQGDVFMFGSYIDFGTSVKCILNSGGTDNYAVAKSTKLPLTYGGYENGKHKLVFNSVNGSSFLYIVDTNSSKPWGIEVSGGEGTSDSPFTFSTVYDWPNNCPQELIIGTDGTCSFAMPASDATVDYEIVRDLATSTKVDLIIGTGSDAVTATADTRLRIQKDNTYGYVPVSALSCNFVDQIENTTIDATGFATAKITPQFYQQGEDDTWNLVTDINTTTKLPNNLQPGQVYYITLKAADGSYYDGETQPSYTVTLFEGYEVAVPAKEFITYYKDEPLYADPQTSADAVLYTITSVSNDQAVLSAAIETSESNPVHSRTPLLVYNPTDVTKKFLLIPADQDPEATQTFYSGFTGTLTATTIAASTTTQNNYALNGKQFVWVKNALDIAANKCYLSVAASNARALNIVFDDAANGDMTGIGSMVNGQSSMVNGDWYDLSGRKLDKKPTQKGIYINNGRKVVIK